MKNIFYGLMLFVLSCKMQNHVDRLAEHESDLTVVSEKESTSKNWLEKGLDRLQELFRSIGEPSPFCLAVFKNSPTRDDYIRNWRPDGEINYCPESSLMLESCQKNHNDAFEAGLLCYKNRFISFDN